MSVVSVVTINKGRRAHLLRLLEGLSRGPAPTECIVVEMGNDTRPVPTTGFPVLRIDLPSEGLPLAAARNAGRAGASGDTLVFLDVDCIPSDNLVAGLDEAVAENDGLVCCEVRYLPAGAVADGWTAERLDQIGHPHPVRRFPTRGIVPAEKPGLFWSLAFAVRSATFDRLGGFDEGFDGYGAEDTDFAFRAAASGVSVLFAGGPHAWHQHHPSCDPPLQHFSDIVRSARRFHARHKIWPMEGWLEAFAERGLIAWDREDILAVLRSPTPDEIAAARLLPDRPF
ncbi:glycosyltransferase [Methylobacterium sp. C25]|uniref:glycosyltransferase family 2 protein n=1 Tax=Methylobacterium sp. C25 TaxID=2721622 RepID=UPI001F3F5A5B|nr:galactosyltransferase-related protein [Methylobacterium sp. C25]MCE4226208.1 glycosyltransferase [Methylobacterium sp. C25]